MKNKQKIGESRNDESLNPQPFTMDSENNCKEKFENEACLENTETWRC